MSYISISQLSALPSNDITNNDLLLISRVKHLTENISPAVSYKLNLYEFKNNISTNIKNYIERNWCVMVENNINTQLNNINTLANNLSIDMYNNLSVKLTTEWYNLSTTLTNNFNTLCIEWHDLSSKISIDYENFKNEIRNNMLNDFNELTADIKNDIISQNEIINNIKIWVKQNFVDLSGNQTIYGQKTFTQDIEGTATSAKWI